MGGVSVKKVKGIYLAWHGMAWHGDHPRATKFRPSHPPSLPSSLGVVSYTKTVTYLYFGGDGAVVVVVGPFLLLLSFQC